MKNPLDGKYVYLTSIPKIHKEIVDLVTQKTGKEDVNDIAFKTGELFLEVSRNTGFLVGSYKMEGLYHGAIEMTLAELEALPDYQPLKKMTVAEICKELGYDVEIVKEK